MIVNEMRRLFNETENRRGNTVELRKYLLLCILMFSDVLQVLLKKEEERAQFEKERAEWNDERLRSKEQLEQERRIAEERLEKERRFRTKDQKGRWSLLQIPVEKLTFQITC